MNTLATTRYRHLLSCFLAGTALALAACDGQQGPTTAGTDADEQELEVPTNRVAIPASVRANLGISFIPVERRRVEKTLRVPGRFEYLPTARREYRTMLPGRVELLVQQFDRVEAGTALYRIDSPAWRDLQQQLAAAESSIQQLTTKLATLDPLEEAHMRHERSLQESMAVWQERVAQLEAVREAGGGRAAELTEARAALASSRAELADIQEKDAELEALRAETTAAVTAARSRLSFLLDSAATIVNMPRDVLTALTGDPADKTPRWATIGTIEVQATEAGIVEALGLTNGSWADEKSAVVSIVQQDRLRFRAAGLQSDLGALRDGLTARIVPPSPTGVGRSIPLGQAMQGPLIVGLQGNANERTIDLFVVPEQLQPWARPGVTAQLEIVTDESATAQLAIPLAAVQRDGMTPIIFRRAPDNPNEAIRIEADLGMDDGRWIAVLSGLQAGDEVVLDGGFQLMLAMSGSIQKGGHFHADGTFHAEDH